MPGGDKRRDVLDGALKVFARDGYSRAGIDAIAATAGVSTRTIYNQFGDKARLFQAVIVDSAGRVAEAHVRTLREQLGRVVDIEADLIEFGLAFAAASPGEYADHFALVQQVNAEVGHVPPAALDAWLRAGPLRVRAELARLLQRIADDGRLEIGDADIAAGQLIALTAGEVNRRTVHGAYPLPEKEIRRLVEAGIHTFLHGYSPPLDHAGRGYTRG